MGRPKLPDSPKYCQACGKLMVRQYFVNAQLEDRTAFSKRKYCNQACMAKAYQGTIKKMNADNSRRQSARTVKAACENCGTTARLHVHHVDENPENNTPSNLMTLCATCHMRWHWTAGKMRLRKAAPCKVCAAPSRKLGYCMKHYQRFRKHGDPLLIRRGNALGSFFVREGRDGKASRCSPRKKQRE